MDRAPRWGHQQDDGRPALFARMSSPILSVPLHCAARSCCSTPIVRLGRSGGEGALARMGGHGEWKSLPVVWPPLEPEEKAGEGGRRFLVLATKKVEVEEVGSQAMWHGGAAWSASGGGAGACVWISGAGAEEARARAAATLGVGARRRWRQRCKHREEAEEEGPWRQGHEPEDEMGCSRSSGSPHVGWGSRDGAAAPRESPGGRSCGARSGTDDPWRGGQGGRQ